MLVGGHQDASLAVFPICTFTNGSCKIHGTGFYVVPNGLFLTAKHVAEEVSATAGHKCLFLLLPNNQYLVRTINRWDFHPTADVAVGWPEQVIDNNTGIDYRAKILTLDVLTTEDQIIAGKWHNHPVMTFAYPLHSIINDSGFCSVNLQPDIYDGSIEQYYVGKGPSAKLLPPYYQTNIHLYGASSGGPVFNADGQIIGIASASYDGANDFSFVTPIQQALETEIQAEFGDEKGCQAITLRELFVRFSAAPQP